MERVGLEGLKRAARNEGTAAYLPAWRGGGSFVCRSEGGGELNKCMVRQGEEPMGSVGKGRIVRCELILKMLRCWNQRNGDTEYGDEPGRLKRDRDGSRNEVGAQSRGMRKWKDKRSRVKRQGG